MEKTLYMLIGPKGSGKSYIGTLVAERTDIVFLRVEPLWLNLSEKEDGWERVETEVAKVFETCQRLMIENLGIGDGFDRFHRVMMLKYRIKRIRVRADLELCTRRVKSRDLTIHIPVSDHKLSEYNRLASEVSYDWALTIDNDGSASDAEIVEKIMGI